jgi:hypothetical protein
MPVIFVHSKSAIEFDYFHTCIIHNRAFLVKLEFAKYSIMFNDNKYTRWYYQIINRAQSRRLPNDCYIETHHIIPKCLGGNDNKDNLVELTAREHFIVHWLLSKMVVETRQKYQMWNAFSCMLYRERPGQHRYKVSSRIFESIKIAGSKIKSEQFSGKNNPMYGKRGELSPHYGKKKSADHLAKLSESHKGVVRTLESRAKQSASMSGRTQTQEHIEKRKCVGNKNGRFGYKMSAEEIAQRTSTLKKNKLAKKLAQEN